MVYCCWLKLTIRQVLNLLFGIFTFGLGENSLLSGFVKHFFGVDSLTVVGNGDYYFSAGILCNEL